MVRQLTDKLAATASPSRICTAQSAGGNKNETLRVLRAFQALTQSTRSISVIPRLRDSSDHRGHGSPHRMVQGGGTADTRRNLRGTKRNSGLAVQGARGSATGWGCKQSLEPRLAIDQLAAQIGLVHLGVLYLIKRASEDVPVEDDKVGQFAFLQRSFLVLREGQVCVVDGI